MLLLSCHKCGTKKKILSPHEELNLWPLDSTLQCSTTDPQRLSISLLTYYLSYSIYIYCVCHLNKTNQLIYGQQIKKLQLNSVLLISA